MTRALSIASRTSLSSLHLLYSRLVWQVRSVPMIFWLPSQQVRGFLQSRYQAHRSKGCAIAWDGHFKVQTADDSFPSVIDYILNCGCFIYIGAWFPFDSYNSPELGLTPWRLVVLMLAILVLRRFPPLLLLYRWVPEVTSWKEALFCGHFGMPIQFNVP